MTSKNTAAIVLAAGLGTRMKSDRPKVLHPLAGRPMLAHILETVDKAGIGTVVVVIGDGMDAVAEVAHPHATVIQHERLGTAHAALQARAALNNFAGDIVILNGDNPLIPTSDLTALIAARRADTDPAIVVLGFRPIDPAPYGRLVIGTDGALERIVEAKDATPEQLSIDLCSSGMMAVDGGKLFDLLSRVGNDNANGEFYLPDIIGLARADGGACAVVEGDAERLIGINSRAELAVAEAILQTRLRIAAMTAGATLIAPETVHFAHDTVLGRDVTVGPYVVFGPGVVVEDGVDIRPFSHLEGARVGTGSRVGPYARLRPGADLAAGVHIGNFVEVKNATLEAGAKANHLSYIGDARIGAGANVGAGTITCNYDGFFKSHTDIGAGAFIGSNSALVAPVKIGDGAIVGAGSVVSRDVAADALAVTRAEQRQIDGWAKRHNAQKSAQKAATKKAQTDATPKIDKKDTP